MRQGAPGVGAARQQVGDERALLRRVGDVARRQHLRQRHPGQLVGARRRHAVGELGQARQPPVERGPVAAAQRRVEAAGQPAVVGAERGARAVAGGLQRARERRRQRLRVERGQRAEGEAAVGRQQALREPVVERGVEAGGARVRAAQHAHRVVVHGARVGDGEPVQRLALGRRRGAEVGAGPRLRQRDQRRLAAALGRGALGQQLGQHRPELRVARGQGQRAHRQAGRGDVAGLQAARHEGAAARLQRALDAVQPHAGHGVALGDLRMHVRHHQRGGAAAAGERQEDGERAEQRQPLQKFHLHSRRRPRRAGTHRALKKRAPGRSDAPRRSGKQSCAGGLRRPSAGALLEQVVGARILAEGIDQEGQQLA